MDTTARHQTFPLCPKSRLARFLRRFYRDEEGTLIIFAVYVFVLMLTVGGIGVDLMRFERDRVHLQYSMDNAVLAAADLEQTREPTAVVNDYLDKMGFLSSLKSIEVIEDRNMRRVSAKADFGIGTQFMHMGGVSELNASLLSAAVEQAPNTEVSLLLDISGSMKTNDRDDLMRIAAKEFISKVLERNQSSAGTSTYQTSVNVVPFAGQTNPGAEIFEYLGGERFGTTTNDDFFPEWPQDTSNIVFWFDTDGDGEIDYSAKIEGYPDADVEMFNKDDLDEYYLYAIDYIERLNPDLAGKMTMIGATIKGGKEPTSFYGITGEEIDGPTKFNNVDLEISFNDFYSNIVPNNVSSCLEMTYADFFQTGLPSGTDQQVAHFVNWDFDSTEQEWGWCPADDYSIQYAQKDETGLHNFIDTLRLHDGTGTNYGMKYALALLDPATQPAFAYLNSVGRVPDDFANRPQAWDAAQSSKYIVLMSDGAIGTQIRPSEALDLQNDDTELTARPAQDSSVSSTNLTNLELFHAQCELAKSKGVSIFTVAFETTQQAAKDLAACASSPSHFFYVNGTGVIDTFVAIASSIQRLRLIQ